MSENSFPFPFGLFPFFLAFHDRNVAVYGKVRKTLRRPSRHLPLHFKPVDFFPLSQPQHHSRVMRRKIASSADFHAAAFQVSRLIGDNRPNGVRIGLFPSEMNSQPVILPAGIVAEK